MIKVFIAGRWTRKDELRAIKRALDTDRRVEALSSWLEIEGDDDGLHDPKRARREGLADLNEVTKADVLFLDTWGDGGGGRYVELGAHMAKRWQTGMRVRVGPPKTIYDHVVHHSFESWAEAIEWFAQWLKRQPRHD